MGVKHTKATSQKMHNSLRNKKKNLPLEMFKDNYVNFFNRNQTGAEGKDLVNKFS